MNRNLHAAKKNKNDEFYTRYEDIEKELQYYKHLLRDKVVYANCDTEDSNFVKWLLDHQEELGIKEVLYSSFDFRNEESIAILKEADIVVTNPPFSLFREYVAQLVEYEKDFLIIGSDNAVTYKEIFPLIKDNEMWLGVTKAKQFLQPDGTYKKFGNIGWYTNLYHDQRNESLFLYKEYSDDLYPKYDNYDAINVDKTCDIPKDYYGYMGVPISFLSKYNPDQFDILGMSNSARFIGFECLTIISGVKKYNRIIIKRKDS